LPERSPPPLRIGVRPAAMSASAPPAGTETDKDRVIEEQREALQAYKDLLDIAAHELRNPMTALLLQVEDALRLVPPHETDILRRLHRLERLIGRTIVRATTLLDASRLNAGTFRPTMEPVDLAEIVREAVDGHTAQAQHMGVALRLTAPDTAEALSDHSAIEQIVDNLLSNAIKFGAGNPVEIDVGHQGDAAVRLSVRDRGPGISPEDQARIFERFERVVTPRTQSGFGLGLWITRRLVEALGGVIRIASTQGEGSTFVVTLPTPPSPPPPTDEHRQP
jgi:two-component system, OmpR family, sensor kinase